MTADRISYSKYLGEGLYASYDTSQERVLIKTSDANNQAIALDRHAAEALLRFMATVWGDSE